jgi:hypothetical protein
MTTPCGVFNANDDATGLTDIDTGVGVLYNTDGCGGDDDIVNSSFSNTSKCGGNLLLLLFQCSIFCVVI